MHDTSKHLYTSKRGATLLIAVLLTAVVLAVGIGIYNRIYKETYFASFWKQTQVAFVAADAGLECALYWEFHSGTPSCFNNTDISPQWSWGTTGGFSTDVYGTNCVKVLITTTGTATTTDVRGYNATCAAVNAGTNPRIVERELQATFGQ